MTISKQYAFLGYGKLRPYWQAEEVVGEGILKYKKVVRSDTKMGAITKMLK